MIALQGDATEEEDDEPDEIPAEAVGKDEEPQDADGPHSGDLHVVTYGAFRR